MLIVLFWYECMSMPISVVRTTSMHICLHPESLLASMGMAQMMWMRWTKSALTTLKTSRNGSVARALRKMSLWLKDGLRRKSGALQQSQRFVRHLLQSMLILWERPLPLRLVPTRLAMTSCRWATMKASPLRVRSSSAPSAERPSAPYLHLLSSLRGGCRWFGSLFDLTCLSGSCDRLTELMNAIAAKKAKIQQPVEQSWGSGATDVLLLKLRFRFMRHAHQDLARGRSSMDLAGWAGCLVSF